MEYILFAGHDYYPLGGWGDFIKGSNDLDELLYLTGSYEAKQPDWWHIVDVHSNKIIKSSHPNIDL